MSDARHAPPARPLCRPWTAGAGGPARASGVAVKVCGITRPGDAALAVELGASAVGLVFWPRSPRAVTIDDARRIAGVLPSSVPAVGVFVNAPPSEVERIVRAAGLTAVQLHGEEDAAAYATCAAQVIKAVAVGPAFVPAQVASVPRDVSVLLDAHDPERRGGTGRTVDWSAAAAAARVRPIILSGGLSAGNVGQAVAAVGPDAVDVSSGVESAPGLKDPLKLRAFFAALQSHP